METMSVNCNSCGGPIEPSWKNSCMISLSEYEKCLYCGNTNKILPNGKTIIENQRRPAPRLSGKNVAPIIIQTRITNIERY